MKTAEVSIKNPVGTILIILTVVVLGFFSIPRIPVSFWPEFVAPTLIVMVPYPGIGPEEIEDQIAKPLEENLSTIDGMDEIETTCMEGMCQVIVRFEWGIDFDQAKLNVQEQTNRARSQFPREILEPRILQVQDFIPPGIEIGFTSDKKDLSEIRDFVESKIKNRFLRLPNVATVQIGGGLEKYVAIWIDKDRLAAYGLSLAQINNALTADNINISAGKLTTPWKNNFIRLQGKYQELSEIENVIVALKGGTPVYLKDVGRVSFEDKDPESITRLNGKEIVSVSIREKSGGNTVAMVKEVKAELESIIPILPDDIQMSIIRDQAEFIQLSLNNVIKNATIGAILAAFIILLFLGNIRNTLVIVLSIPVSVIGTFILINAFDLSINTISLGGLALGVGMIVDASIVVLENIFRHLRENSAQNRLTAVVEATREVGLAVTSSTLTSIVVFLPLAFLTGLFAVLLGELALTVVFSLTLSVIVALTIVPLLSYKLMRTELRVKGWAVIALTWQNLFQRLIFFYRKVIRWCLQHRIFTVTLAILILILSVVFILPLLEVELLPAINQGEFRLELTLPEGTRLEITDELARKIENKLASRPDLAQIYSQVGVFSARGELKSNFATLTIDLKPEKISETTAVMEELRQEFSHLPGTKVVIRQTDVTEGMRREPINVRIFGDDLVVLEEIGQRLIPDIEKIEGVVNLNSTLQEGLSEFRIHIDRTRANDLGLNFRQVAQSVRSAVLGNSDTRLSTHGKEYDIIVKLDHNQLQNLNDLLDLPLLNNRGAVIPLRAVADISIEKSLSEIKRLNQQRMLEIKADVAGRSQREVTAEVKNAVGQINLPPDYYLGFGGQSRAISESFRSLLMALVIAIFLVYVVMGAQFNSFIHPFTIAFTIPLAVIGVLLGLLIFGASLSMNALLGMILLVGIVVNNGIILIDYINQLRTRGMQKNEAIIEAGATRLRPIFITSLTTIFGMLPIALGLGKGGEALQPLGAVVAGGLATSSFMTLLVIPCVYSVLDQLRKNK